jgi:hypothetical protein
MLRRPRNNPTTTAAQPPGRRLGGLPGRAVPLLRPGVAFVGGNPLLLSVEGEYVAKNLVLLAATASPALHTLGTRPVTATGHPALGAHRRPMRPDADRPLWGVSPLV